MNEGSANLSIARRTLGPALACGPMQFFAQEPLGELVLGIRDLVQMGRINCRVGRRRSVLEFIPSTATAAPCRKYACVQYAILLNSGLNPISWRIGPLPGSVIHSTWTAIDTGPGKPVACRAGPAMAVQPAVAGYLCHRCGRRSRNKSGMNAGRCCRHR